MEEPPVACMPHCVWLYSFAGGACSIKILFGSASSSSASSMVSVVQMPCPISTCASITFILLSGVICKKALGINAVGAAGPPNKFFNRPALAGMINDIIRPPPNAAPVFKKDRRFTVVASFILRLLLFAALRQCEWLFLFWGKYRSGKYCRSWHRQYPRRWG